MILVEHTIDSAVRYVSIEGNHPDYDWTYNWKPQLVSFESPQYRLTKAHGGVSRLSFGGASYSPDLFLSDWPPQVSCPVTCKYTATNDATPETFFVGTAHLSQITQDQITYDYYDDAYDVDLLEETTDYNSDTVPLPRALGAVVHVNPVRLPDVTGDPCYHKGYVSGTKGTDWHVYDDGVNIDSNVTDEGDGTFTLSAAPVGEVTLSGTGDLIDLEDLIEWACGATLLNLTSDTTDWDNTIPDFSYWASSQKNILDFISDACAWFCHLVYIKATTLYLVDMDTDVATRTITEYQFFPSTYEYQPPIYIARAEWVEREAGEFYVSPTATARYVRNIDKETSVESAYSYGSDESFQPMCNNKTDIDTCLTAILAIVHKPRCRLRIPLQGSLPVPGEKISWTDTMLGVDTDFYIRARSITYDFDNDEIIIEGEGAISAS